MSKLLTDLTSELDQGFLEETFEVQKHKYKIRLLTDGETNWKNRFIDGMASSMALLSSRKAPTLAVGIREIDGTKVPDIFLEDLKDEDKEKVNKLSALDKQFWGAEKLLEWLSKRPSDFTGELYGKYAELEERRREVQQNLKN